MQPLGLLAPHDPLHDYLRCEVLPLLGVREPAPQFRVHRLRATKQVYVYEDVSSGARVVGKFFGVDGRDPAVSAGQMRREFDNLALLRRLGFNGFPHYVARPLGQNAALSALLVEEYCEGARLDEVVARAVAGEAGHDGLFEKLTALGHFLARMHNVTASAERVDFAPQQAYFAKVTGALAALGYLGEGELGELSGALDAWASDPIMREDVRVLVHGDPTPANLLFGDGPWVIALDLERMRPADRAHDVGCVVGELKHAFLEGTGSAAASEPFIGHFLWAYASRFPDHERAFRAVCRRVPFYLGLTLLRVMRNSWISAPHRRALLEQARAVLRR